jgi:hypothetical protein
MNNSTMTVKMWDEITEVQAETLNGGSGSGKYTFNGSIGFVQINEGDGVIVSTSPVNVSTVNKNRGRNRHH